MSPKGLAALLGALAGLSLSIGAGFWWMGVPAVLPFACVETLCLAAAMLIYARRASDGDWVDWSGRHLRVRTRRHGIETVSLWPAGWTRVKCVDGVGIELRCGVRAAVIACHVPAAQRPALAQALRHSLWQVGGACGPV